MVVRSCCPHDCVGDRAQYGAYDGAGARIGCAGVVNMLVTGMPMLVPSMVLCMIMLVMVLVR